MKKLDSFKALAKEMTAIKNVAIPKCYANVLNLAGAVATEIAKEEIIGVTSPLGPTVLPETGQAFGGWDYHSPITPQLKAARGGGKGGNPATYLYDSGQMYASITYKVKAIKSVAVGSNVPHAHDMEYGDITRNVPARPFLGPAIIRMATRLKPQFHAMLTQALSGEKVA